MLTVRQLKMLHFIVRFIDQHGYPPTLHESAAAMGSKYHSAAQHYYRILRREGYITWSNQKQRTLRVLDRGPYAQ